MFRGNELNWFARAQGFDVTHCFLSIVVDVCGVGCNKINGKISEFL